MTDVVIRSEGLSKSYLIGHQGPRERYTTLRDAVARQARTVWESTRRAWRGQAVIAGQEIEEFWALRDVSFDIKQGEVVGIIGRNGAGKSTLLKILSRITEPTEGRVTLRGRVASLLEVGTGFHPELTGRENVFLNGAILGMSRAEIKRKFDEIVAFADADMFLDTPVKRYSSGMQVRLAFAVAAHLEPEILVVDEVLAVGDAEFQKKCLGKMRDVATGGRTVLFVSHNMGAVRRLCSRSILLVRGRLEQDGDSNDVIDAYLRGVSDRGQHRASFSNAPTLPMVLCEVSVKSHVGVEDTPIDFDTPIAIEIAFQVREQISGAIVSIACKRDGITVFRSWDSDNDEACLGERAVGDYVASITIPAGLLTPGNYSIDVSAGRPSLGKLIVRHEDCVSFSVDSVRLERTKHSACWGGLVAVPVKWSAAKRQSPTDRSMTVS